MTLRLILMRHTKSDWQDATLSDHDRPLNARGRHAAQLLGQWLHSRGYQPDQVLCSDALRTRQTWAGLAASALGGQASVQILPALYNANPDQIWGTITPQTAQTLMVVAHNPGIAELATRLLAHPPRSTEFAHYPTGATTVLEFSANNWADATPSTASLLDFVMPRALETPQG